MNKTFEDYLAEIHAEDYQGLDDNMTDCFNDWLGELSVDETIIYANQYVKQAIASQRKESLINIGQLRQWLNEERITDLKKMVSNEQIKIFLTE